MSCGKGGVVLFMVGEGLRTASKFVVKGYGCSVAAGGTAAAAGQQLGGIRTEIREHAYELIQPVSSKTKVRT